MKRYLLLLSFALAVSAMLQAQSLEEYHNLWNENSENTLENIRHTGTNPSRILFNTIKDKGISKLEYGVGMGKFRKPDAAENINGLDVYIGGIKHFEKTDVMGFITYKNLLEKNRKWNSTLFLNPDNPFILGDSVASNTTTESFEMGMTTAHIIKPKWRCGVSLTLKMGNLSDQTDPRAETKSIVLPVHAGIEYKCNKTLALGLTTGMSVFHSHIGYTNINTLKHHRYFLMKGMGDYYRISSNDISSYQRSYTGRTYLGTLQLVWTPQNTKYLNFTEIEGKSVKEKAIDGGSSYKFYGGDYSAYEIMLQNRHMFQPTAKTRHHFLLSANISFGKAVWYDQKKMTDTEHGNMTYYETLSRYNIQDNNRTTFSLEYRFEKIKQMKADYYIDLQTKIESYKTRHQLPSGNELQKYSMMEYFLATGKKISLKSVSLDLMASTGYRQPITSVFGNGNSRVKEEDISAIYTLPGFTYYSSAHLMAGAQLKVSIPCKKNIIVGAYARTDVKHYTGKENHHTAFNRTERINATAGIFMTF